MLTIFPDQSDDLLDVDALPPTDKTELNYRTRPLTAQQELRLTLLVLLGAAPIALLVSVPTSVLTTASTWIDDMVFAAGPVLMLWLFIRRLMGAIVRWEILGALLFLLCSLGGLLWEWAARDEFLTWGYCDCRYMDRHFPDCTPGCCLDSGGTGCGPRANGEMEGQLAVCGAARPITRLSGATHLQRKSVLARRRRMPVGLAGKRIPGWSLDLAVRLRIEHRCRVGWVARRRKSVATLAQL